MVRILGVDPGSHCTGYGIIAQEGGNVRYISSGVIRLPRQAERFERLRMIFETMGEVIARENPAQFAIEDVFYSRNARSALVLGEARGAAILAAAVAGIPVAEYTPREVKLSVTGNGAAHKSQVNFMLGRILGLSPPPESTDESDAIAIAMCHAFRENNWSPV